MKIKLVLAIFIVCITFSNLTHAGLEDHNTNEPTPSYAKWGKLAVEETKTRYKDFCVVDYLHIGKVVGPNESSEKFKLWLRACPGKREFGIYVTIAFNNETEEVTEILFKETTQ